MLTSCHGNSFRILPVFSWICLSLLDSLYKRLVMWSFGVFFIVSQNRLLKKLSSSTMTSMWRHSNVFHVTISKTNCYSYNHQTHVRLLCSASFVKKEEITICPQHRAIRVKHICACNIQLCERETWPRMTPMHKISYVTGNTGIVIDIFKGKK